MLLELENKSNCLIGKLKGELDHHNSEKTRQEIDRYFLDKNLKNIILDLRELTFMDSSGIGLIMGRYRNTVDRNGKLLIVNDNKHVERILKMSGLLKIIKLYPTVDMAIENL